jgi:hypothetical protein
MRSVGCGWRGAVLHRPDEAVLSQSRSGEPVRGDEVSTRGDGIATDDEPERVVDGHPWWDGEWRAEAQVRDMVKGQTPADAVPPLHHRWLRRPAPREDEGVGRMVGVVKRNLDAVEDPVDADSMLELRDDKMWGVGASGRAWRAGACWNKQKCEKGSHGAYAPSLTRWSRITLRSTAGDLPEGAPSASSVCTSRGSVAMATIDIAPASCNSEFCGR